MNRIHTSVRFICVRLYDEAELPHRTVRNVWGTGLIARGELRMKAKFDQFFGFLGSGRPSPFVNCIDGGTGEHGTAADHLIGFGSSVGGDYHLDFDGSL